MSLRRDMQRLTAQVGQLRTAVEMAESTFAEDPVGLMEAAGLDADAWQRDVLLSKALRQLLLVTRQGGKSTTTAVKALFTALFTAGSLVLLLSPSLRQSQELFAKVVSIYRAAGEPVALKKLSALRLELVHGSRIIALPGTEKTIRGFSSVDLLVIDEAARVLDELYYAVRPMLAVSGGELVALTTPWGKRGWFYEEWTRTADGSGGPDWHRVRVTAEECPRISETFLAEERQRLPAAWFRSEYLCEFTDTIDAAFRSEDIERAIRSDVAALFPTEPAPSPPSTPSPTVPTTKPLFP